ncbi:MAG: glycosyltransferase family 2 protein [Bacillota bacterium]
MASVDVIVPCYRYGHYLRDCVQSVLDQQGVEVRVLIIDDASPDDTPAVAAELAERDGRVEYRRHVANQGHIATYNEGLDWIASDYALLLSADDMLTRGALGRAAMLMDAHPEVGLVYGRAFRTPCPPFVGWQPPENYTWRTIPGQELIETMCVQGDNLVPTPTAIVRTRLQRAVGGYRKDLPHTADMEMWLRLAAHGAVGILDIEQAYYRIHGANMSTAYVGLRDMQSRYAAIGSILQQYDNRIADVAGLKALAERAIAEQVFWIGSNSFDRGDWRGCAECLKYARGLYPALRWQPKWYRFRCKQLLGPKLWSAVRPVIHRIRAKGGPNPTGVA